MVSVFFLWIDKNEKKKKSKLDSFAHAFLRTALHTVITLQIGHI